MRVRAGRCGFFPLQKLVVEEKNQLDIFLINTIISLLAKILHKQSPVDLKGAVQPFDSYF